MGATENVFAGVLIIIIFLGFTIFINRSTTEYIVTEYEIVKQSHLYDLYSTNFNTILQISEPKTKRTMSSLLANSLYYREEVLNFSDKSVNITEEFKIILDEVYGENRYYLSIKPKIIDVSLNFVIDGSNSLQSEREKLAAELPAIVEKVKAKINETGEEWVTADVFILEEATETSLCSVFPEESYDHLSSRSCSIIDNNKIYSQIRTELNNETFMTNSTDYLKFQFNLTAPYEDKNDINSKREGGIKDYFGSDWGTGTAYISILRRDAARLVVIFPMGDELSTSSINEDCFDMPINNFQKRAEQKMCDLCEKSCSDTTDTETEIRSRKTIEKAVTVAKSFNHIINPIFAYNCDYEYKDIFNAQYLQVYGTSTTHACSESNCRGCSAEGTDTCFHPECKNEILAQMEYIADSTNGKVIDLKEIENLDYDIEGTIRQNIEEYKFELGRMRNGTRYVITRSIPLPNRMMVDAKLYIFPENRTAY
jgi:hypothetical protein